jgi:hypothetical protein
MCEFVPLRRNDLQVDQIDYGRAIGVFFKDRCVLRMTIEEAQDMIEALDKTIAAIGVRG